jgi:hypothetical protein
MGIGPGFELGLDLDGVFLDALQRRRGQRGPSAQVSSRLSASRSGATALHARDLVTMDMTDLASILEASEVSYSTLATKSFTQDDQSLFPLMDSAAES